ncbi:MAG: aminotransferase class I/II-fold pyridoxal phosphate-dependent enzyme [Actinobacteria bacterium]|nr:aminotransferase class I/II-fold pyridoxal phosphate-dependent enzyme [Actinomycetota bacterium]
MEVLDRVSRLRAEGRDVVSLCAGEPSQGAPTDVHRLAEAQHRDRRPLTYTPALGLPELREAIAGHYRRWYGLDVATAEVGVTTGASGAFVAVFLAAFDPGDRVAVVRPGYPAYRNLLASLGLSVVELPVGPDTGFQPTVEHLARAHAEAPLHGLVLASPANPTGSMVTRDELAALVSWCAEHDVRLVSDEIYHGITYPPGGDRGTCAWEFDRRTVVVSSFSKYWGMTGWRLGWALLPDDLRGPVDSFVGNAALCPPTTAQHPAIGAFTDASYDECDARVATFAETRALLLDRVPALGWGPIAPADGAFYLYAGIAGRLGPHADATAWCRALLEDGGVALVPGSDFDGVDGTTFVRLSFAAGTAAVAEALDRIAAWTPAD